MNLSPLSNPLPPLWVYFQISENAFKVVKRVIRQTHAQNVDCQLELLKYQRHLLNHTKFPTQDNLELLIKQSEKDNQDLFILGLWATFERDFLKDSLFTTVGGKNFIGVAKQRF